MLYVCTKLRDDEKIFRVICGAAGSIHLCINTANTDAGKTLLWNPRPPDEGYSDTDLPITANILEDGKRATYTIRKSGTV